MAGELERCSWRKRSPEFTVLAPYDDGRPIVAMAMEPPDRKGDEWQRLCEHWLELPPHPHILEALDRNGSKLLLRYAGLDWNRADTLIKRHIVATWAVQLVDVYRAILEGTPEPGRFLRPLAKIDLVSELRVGFLPVVLDDPELPPELASTFPHCEPTAAVYVVGRVIRLLALGPWEEPITSVIQRCMQVDPAQRYPSLGEVRAVLAPLALPALETHRREAWHHAQEGLGWLGIADPVLATRAFREAVQINPRLDVARAGRDVAVAMLDRLGGRKPATWDEIAPQGQELERARDYVQALALYRSVLVTDDATEVNRLIAIARCNLALGSTGSAIEDANRALARSTKNVAALAVVARAYLERRDPEALVAAAAWLVLAPNDANAHYVSGRALFSLKRFVEARAAFDRACALQPTMLEAMLLRRETDRAMKRIAEVVGTPIPMVIELADHLGHLREVLANGRVDEAIGVLSRPEYVADGIAKLVHAECLAFAQRYDEALAMFDLAASLGERDKAIVGRIHALFAMDRVGEALAELAAAPDLPELRELRRR